MAATDLPFFGCGYCHEVYPTEAELKVHMKMDHPDKPYKSHPAPMPEHEQHALRDPTSAISKGLPLSEVQRHCIPSDCWVALNGKVYDLTEFMGRHPGGPTTISNAAGKDASQLFNNVHKGVKIEQYLLPDAFVGTLGIDEDLMTDSYWHSLRKARVEELEVELKQLETVNGLASQNESLAEILRSDKIGKDFKARLQFMETQKRVAMDNEEFEKAQFIEVEIGMILAEAKVHRPAATAPCGGIPLAEVARHNKIHDCWIAVNKDVYDLTDFIQQHPEQRNAVLAWAGRDATSVWNKIPGRFPSQTWLDMFGRPEFKIGEYAGQPALDPSQVQLQQLRAELHRLKGPSDEDIQAAKTAAKGVEGNKDVSKAGEDARFPRLAELRAGKELNFYSRAEVAKHGAGDAEPWMIIHNKVYNLKSLLGAHPGGDDVLLKWAGSDATKEFEVFEHSEKARMRRDQEQLVGEIVPAEHIDLSEAAAVGGGVAGGPIGDSSELNLSRYIKHKAMDAACVAIAAYIYRSWKHSKPLPTLMYSRALRHLHLIMALGIFGTLSTAQLAKHAEGLAKKSLLAIHKQTGFAMFIALILRIFVRMQSGIPPRFPGNPTVQWIETQSLKAFYVLGMVLPVSGMASEYFSKYAPGGDITGNKADDERNDRLAMQSIDVHKKVGRFFQTMWLPFHLGYTTLYHYTMGRGVVRKVSPFI